MSDDVRVTVLAVRKGEDAGAVGASSYWCKPGRRRTKWRRRFGLRASSRGPGSWTQWMMLARRLADYIAGLRIGQGRYYGQPFPLIGWQRRLLRCFDRPGDAALSLGRGGGKSTLIAAIGAAAVDVDGPLVSPGAQTVVVASSFDQGKEAVFDMALWFLGPTLAKHGTGPKGRFRLQDSANRAVILDRETRASLRVVGAEPKRGHGLQPRLIIADEVAQWEPGSVARMLAALKTSRGKIEDSKMIWLGTRPSTPEHPFQRALDGHGTAFQVTYAAPLDAPPFQRRTWRRANPGLDMLPDLEAVIREEAGDARVDPDALASFRALRLNQGTPDTERAVLLDADAWRRAGALAEPDAEDRGGHVLGIDLGTSAAMSAAAAYHRDGRLEAVAVFPEVPDLRARGLADGVGALYRRMAERGELLVAGRRVSDISALLAETLTRWGRPAAVVVDRWREAELRDALDAVRFPRVELVVRGQGFRDGGEDVRAFRRAVLSELVRPAESLLLTAAMAEARVTTDPAGNSKLSKGSEGGRRVRARDDAAAAAILAVAAGYREWHAAPRPKRPLRTALAG